MNSSEPLAPRDLQAFVCAVETGSVKAAADALMLTQSAATRRIQNLERRLGVALLERGARGVAPTEAGRALYPEAKEALAVLERARERTLSAASGRLPALALAASHTVGGFLLPGWLARFRAGFPGVAPRVEVVNSPGVLALVRDGSADIGFVEGDDDLGEFERLAVGDDELAVVVAASHRWARRASVRPAELVGEPLCAREAGSGTRAIAEQRLAQTGTVLVPSLQMASTESLKRAVLDGGFALMSRHAVAGELSAGQLAALPVSGVDLSRTLWAVRRPGSARDAAASAMWSWLELHAAAGELAGA